MTIKTIADNIKDKSKALLDTHYPRIEEMIIKRLLETNSQHVDNAMSNIFEHSYDLLPLIVRLAISKEKYLEFLDSKRPQLKSALNLIKKETRARTNTAKSSPVKPDKKVAKKK